MNALRLLTLSATFAMACVFSSPVSSDPIKKGQKVWSKQYETPLRVEPRPLAAVETTIGFAEKLSVREVQGTWLRVKSSEGEGWVFQGNVATDKPSLAPAAGLTTFDASRTDTVAAARPLSPAAQGYAQRHGAADAEADIDWIDAQAAELAMEEIIAWMSAEQLGEYQE